MNLKDKYPVSITMDVDWAPDFALIYACNLLKKNGIPTTIFATHSSPAFEDRKKLAFFYARLANLFVKQEFLVIVATVSMFEDVRKWNRRNNDKYCEVYLRVDKQTRVSRDSKKLYESNTNLVEFKNGFDEPKKPDIIFDDFFDLDQMVNKVKIYLIEKLNA